MLAGLGCVVIMQGQVGTNVRELVPKVFRNPSPGYLMIAPNGMDTVSLMDNTGYVPYKAYARVPTNLLSTDGTITHFIAQEQKYVRRDQWLNPIDTFHCPPGFAADFHEGRILKNGNFLLLGIETRFMDMSTVVPNGKANARIFGAVIWEIEPDGDIVFTWKSLDVIPVTDATEDIDLTADNIDYIHVNSVSEDSDGHFLVSCRNIDEVIKLHRTTGAIKWRFGGSASKNNQFDFIGDQHGTFVGFSHQHTVSRTSSGTILMYDNGNLRPEEFRFSRAVEYSLDTVKMEARRVWQYRHSPDLFAQTMGSAIELETGNILIGWGNTRTEVICTEVSKDGTVQLELETAPGEFIPAYRTWKAPVAMTRSLRMAVYTGPVTFTSGDSTTHMSINITSNPGRRSVFAERHFYSPQHATVVGDEPCTILPTRFTLRFDDTSNVRGTMAFSLGTLPGIVSPGQITLLHRPTEGAGEFRKVAAAYDGQTGKLNVNSLLFGEFALAYVPCYVPTLITPVHEATNVAVPTRLSWSTAVGDGRFEVEVVDSDGKRVFLRTISRTDTNIFEPKSATTHQWRVRSRLGATYGPWSDWSTFTTRLGTPVLVTPRIVGTDTIGQGSRPTFVWRSVNGATSYAFTLRKNGTATALIDTMVTDTVFRSHKNLDGRSLYLWTVSAFGPAGTGPQAELAAFMTAPSAPLLISPNADATMQQVDGLMVRWDSVSGAVSYHLEVRETVGGQVVAEDSITAKSFQLNGLKRATSYTWRVRSIGRNGAGDFSPSRRFRTIADRTIRAPIVVAPTNGEGRDPDDIVLTWNAVDSATYYHVVVTRDIDNEVIVEFPSITTTSVVVPSLDASTDFSWKVMGLADDANGTWSDAALFRTNATAAAIPRPVSPPWDAIEVPERGVVTFTTNPVFKEYRVEFALDDSFDDIVYTSPTTSGSATYDVPTGRTIWWRVAAVAPTSSLPDYSTSSRFHTRTSMGIRNEVTDSDIRLFVESGTLRVTTQQNIHLVTASVYDVTGRIVLRREFGSGVQMFEQDTQLWGTGTYLVSLVSTTGHRQSFVVCTE